MPEWLKTLLIAPVGLAVLIGGWVAVGFIFIFLANVLEPYIPEIPPGDYRIVGWVALTALLAFLAGQAYQQWRDR